MLERRQNASSDFVHKSFLLPNDVVEIDLAH
jgi:hypothetical protein